MPVLIDVREAPFHTVRYGGGVGIDPARQEMRAVAEYTDRNFLGGLRKLTAQGQGGLGLPSGRLGHPVPTGSSSTSWRQFTQPNFFAPSLKFLTSVNLYKQVEDGYGYIGGRGRAGRGLESALPPHPLPLLRLRAGLR